MAARRKLAWAAALRDIKDDRAVRSPVRFEPIRKVSTTNALGAWRGNSGQRYVVQCIPLEIAIAADLRDCVAIACSLDDNHIPHIVDVACVPRLFATGWIIEALAAGAVELHLYSLQDLGGCGPEVVSDLTEAL
jgi:hypothetical protein